MDLSIIIPSHRPNSLAHVLTYLNNQHADGLIYEIIIIQESNSDFNDFTKLSYGPRTKILRQQQHNDCGAVARDRGVVESTGEYVVFWDDDNIYYPHAIATMFTVANGFDIGIAKVKHYGTIIPINSSLKAGDIDSMCFCVRRCLVTKVKWADHGGRYNDFRWITKISSVSTSMNRSPLIIGEHL